MDVNGTRYHLLVGSQDWSRCLVEVDGAFQSLASLWQQDDGELESDSSGAALRSAAPLEYVRAADSYLVDFPQSAPQGLLQLSRETVLFHLSGHGQEAEPLDQAARRGAGRDQYGNWFWIGPHESTLRALPNGKFSSLQYWDSSGRKFGAEPAHGSTPEVCEPTSAPAPGVFTDVTLPNRDRLLLRGLAVTTRQYLVVGDPLEHGLLLFDLHGGGDPTLLVWPQTVPFDPWDIAATADGGLLVLDRTNKTYWTLDASFRLLAAVGEAQEALFQPQPPPADPPPNKLPAPVLPLGHSLEQAGESLSPVAIEAGPDGTVLILDTDTSQPTPRGYSILYIYRGDQRLAALSLQHVVEVVDPLAEGEPYSFALAGHDLAFVPAAPLEAAADTAPSLPNCDGEGAAPAAPAKPAPGTLYIAEWYGNQTFAFDLAAPGSSENDLPIQRVEYLPLRRWEGKGLVAADGMVYYDFAERWIALQAYPECQYQGRALFVTPLETSPLAPGSPFDSNQPGCVWHRLLLDAIIPSGTQVLVRARAADSPELLEQSEWRNQPRPYLRSGGCEIPFYDPWEGAQAALPEAAGTWELLFQQVFGRYIQLEITMLGTGRSTPGLLALRAWYPRFSYLEHYLPAFYQEDALSASFMERWLANFEGLYSNLEDKIEHIPRLLDPRTALPETLDWLACWLGLVLDPLWPEDRRRFFIRNAHQFYRWRGTLYGMAMALRVYLDPCVSDDLFQPASLTGAASSTGAASQLSGGAEPFGQARIIELFRSRDIGGKVYGDPSGANPGQLRDLTYKDIRDSAHRFRVLVPHTLTEDQQVMVSRIVALEKPAHTDCEVSQYFAMFRVGEARLGMDTRLSESSTFAAMILNCGRLNESYLPASYPFDITGRLVSDRDTLGDFPAL